MIKTYKKPVAKQIPVGKDTFYCCPSLAASQTGTGGEPAEPELLGGLFLLAGE